MNRFKRGYMGKWLIFQSSFMLWNCSVSIRITYSFVYVLQLRICHFKVTESFRLEKTFRIINSNHHLTPPISPLTHVPKHHISTSLEHPQGWWLHHFPEMPIPLPGHSFHEEILPDTQPKPPLVQFDAISFTITSRVLPGVCFFIYQLLISHESVQ